MVTQLREPTISPQAVQHAYLRAANFDEGLTTTRILEVYLPVARRVAEFEKIPDHGSLKSFIETHLLPTCNLSYSIIRVWSILYSKLGEELVEIAELQLPSAAYAMLSRTALTLEMTHQLLAEVRHDCHQGHTWTGNEMKLRVDALIAAAPSLPHTDQTPPLSPDHDRGHVAPLVLLPTTLPQKDDLLPVTSEIPWECQPRVPHGMHLVADRGQKAEIVVSSGPRGERLVVPADCHLRVDTFHMIRVFVVTQSRRGVLYVSRRFTRQANERYAERLKGIEIDQERCLKKQGQTVLFHFQVYTHCRGDLMEYLRTRGFIVSPDVLL